MKFKKEKVQSADDSYESLDGAYKRISKLSEKELKNIVVIQEIRLDIPKIAISAVLLICIGIIIATVLFFAAR